MLLLFKITPLIDELWLLRHAGYRETENVVDQILEITTTGGLKNKEVIFISSVLDEEINSLSLFKLTFNLQVIGEMEPPLNVRFFFSIFHIMTFEMYPKCLFDKCTCIWCCFFSLLMVVAWFAWQ